MKRRKMSKEARQRISAAQKKRWENKRNGKTTAMPNEDRFRRFARTGALAEAKQIVTEFPDILAELNELAR